jgi:CDP-diacylglycerol--glycerol-3-phosphate 3-phosphatidyltransferase
MLDNRYKPQIEKVLQPLGSFLNQHKISPNLLTLAGLGFATVTSFFLIEGWFWAGLIGLIFSSLPDMLDGAVARVRPKTDSLKGAFLDSVIDRVVDLLLFGGIGVYGVINENHVLAILGFFAYGAASLVSYQRAKAESLAMYGKGGFFERAERLIFLGVGLAFYPYLETILFIIVVGTTLSAGWRFYQILKVAQMPSTTQPPKARITRLVHRKSMRTRKLIRSKGHVTRSWAK